MAPTAPMATGTVVRRVAPTPRLLGEDVVEPLVARLPAIDASPGVASGRGAPPKTGPTPLAITGMTGLARRDVARVARTPSMAQPRTTARQVGPLRPRARLATRLLAWLAAWLAARLRPPRLPIHPKEDAPSHPVRAAPSALVDATGQAASREATDPAIAMPMGLPSGALVQGPVVADLATPSQAQVDATTFTSAIAAANPTAACAELAAASAVGPRIRIARVQPATARVPLDAVGVAVVGAAVEAAAGPIARAPAGAIVQDAGPPRAVAVPAPPEADATIAATPSLTADLATAAAAATATSAVIQGRSVTRQVAAAGPTDAYAPGLAARQAPTDLAAAAAMWLPTSGDRSHRWAVPKGPISGVY